VKTLPGKQLLALLVIAVVVFVAAILILRDRPTTFETPSDSQQEREIPAENRILFANIEYKIKILSRIGKTPAVEAAQLDLHNTEALEKLRTELNSELDAAVTELRKAGKFANPLWGKNDAELKDIIAKLTPEQKAGQLLMFAFPGQASNPRIQDILSSKPTGLILMGNNVSSASQVRSLTKSLQAGAELPLLVATDQEGGVVKRIPWDPTPGQTRWAGKSTAEVCDYGRERARVLKDVGINLNFAPVVDLSPQVKGFISNRTISSDPKQVSELGAAFSSCSEQEGVYTSYKHFPGHGATTEDSHLVLPVIKKSKANWLVSDGIPYKDGIKSSLVMVGHLKFTDFDANEPATQSPQLINGFLRQELGFEGVAITDAMGQLHGSTKIDARSALKKAFNAGIDIALYVSLPAGESEKSLRATVVDLFKTGEIKMETADKSLLRILKLKRELYF
jgi:beta-N-acetylhexosaminidase